MYGQGLESCSGPRRAGDMLAVRGEYLPKRDVCGSQLTVVVGSVGTEEVKMKTMGEAEAGGMVEGREKENRRSTSSEFLRVVAVNPVLALDG